MEDLYEIQSDEYIDDTLYYDIFAEGDYGNILFG